MDSRLDSLTGARFVAAFLVFCFHVATLGLFAPETGVSGPLTLLTKSAGTVGVSFFFVLSGFVLTWSARPADTYGGFLRRRLVKIFPNHVVTFALAMALFAAAATPLPTVLANLFLVQAWVPDPATFLSVNGPSWSLSCELVFYLLFPALLALSGRIRRLWWWAGGVVALIVLLPVLGSLLLPSSPRFELPGTVLDGQSIYPMWLVYIFPPARLLDFFLGILTARIVMSGKWIGLGVRPAALLAVLGYVAGLFTPMVFTVDVVTVVPLALLIAALATAERQGASPLGRPVWRRLGEASFAFYLIHEIVLVLVRAAIGFDTQLGVLPGIAAVLVALALSVGLAFALHRWVEQPAMRRWARARTPALAS